MKKIVKKNKQKIMKTAILITASLALIKGNALPGNNYLVGPFKCLHNGVLYSVTMNNCRQYTAADHNHYAVPTNASGIVSTAYDDEGNPVKKFDHTDLDCILQKLPGGH